MTARIEGQTYDIPPMWLVGMARRGYSTVEAIRYWHEQEIMSAQPFPSCRDGAET